MNQNVFNYLNEKANDVMDFFHTKFDAVGTYLTDHAHDIQQGLVKGTAGVLTAAALLGGMTGCQQNRPVVNPNETKPPISGTLDPSEPVRSESGLFFGVPYDQDDLPPAIEHRTEEEIAETGLTAQDVLNAYDQLAIDIVKAAYASPYYDRLPDKAYESATAQFISLAPPSTTTHDPETYEEIVKYAPFFAVDPHFIAEQTWQDMILGSKNKFPAFPLTINIQAYVDGVCYTERLSSIAAEPSSFESLMTTFGKESTVLTQEKLQEIAGNGHPYTTFVDQVSYPPMTITRETILSATPEQLEAIYNMLISIRTITLEQRLPSAEDYMDMN